MVTSASAPALSRRGFLKTAALAPAVAPMIAASASQDGLAYLQGLPIPFDVIKWPGTVTGYGNSAGFAPLGDELHSTTEQVGRALHHIPVPLRRIDGKYIGEIVTVPDPISADEREARADLARSVLPLAAQVQMGVAL